MSRKLKTFEDLTEEDIEYIIKSREKGVSYKIIGAKFFTTETSARTWAIKLGCGKINKENRITKEQQILQLVKTNNVDDIARAINTSVDYILYILRKHNISSYEKGVKSVYNPNPPTNLTIILINNYYNEDVNRRKMTHEQAINDIMTTLCRPKEYIEKVLSRGDKQ